MDMKALAIILQCTLCIHALLTECSTTVPSIESELPACGKRPLVDAPGGSRVVGGHNAPVGAWPWLVSVQVRTAHVCGGSIINSLWVLTASHCFTSKLKTSDLRVVAGLNVLSTPGKHSQHRPVHRVVQHENFIRATHWNDITLLQLSTPLHFNDYVQPLCILANETEEFHLNFNHCFISGWGSDYYNGVLINTLQEAEVELIDRNRCNLIDWYSGMIADSMICAGTEAGAIDTCQGDSGGPLQCYSENHEKFYIVGVTSFGEACGLPKRPGVYTRTSKYAAWLKRIQGRTLSAACQLDISTISLIFSALLIGRLV